VYEHALSKTFNLVLEWNVVIRIEVYKRAVEQGYCRRLQELKLWSPTSEGTL